MGADCPQVAKCRCKCGYTCGGPGVCKEPFQTCLGKHFSQDCDHQWDGPTRSIDVMGCEGEGATCSVCGMSQVVHDIWVGP